MIATLLGWTKLPQWAMELAVIAALGCGFWWYHHHVFVQGIAAQQAADQKASTIAIAKAAVATKAAQDAANRAEESYREEVARNAAAAAAHPIGSVRLCIDTHVGSQRVPETGPAHPGNESARTSAGSVSRVSARNPGLRPKRTGPDLEGLLGAWAAKADGVSATLREFQSRGVQ